MFKKIAKKFIPDADKLKQHPLILRLGKRAQHSPMWHFNRRGICRGIFIGMFFALLPLPFRTLPVILFCFLARANLIAAIACTWIFNYVFLGPVYYMAYQLGRVLLHQSAEIEHWQQITEQYQEAWQPLLLGSLIFASIAALIGFFIAHGILRYRIVQRWRARLNRDEEH